MAKKIQIKEIDLRNRVYSFVKLNPGMPDSSVVKHFMLEGFARSTLYDILKRKANNLDAERKIGSGRPAKKMTKIAVKRLKSRIDHSHGISQRKLGRIFEVSQSMICKTLQNETSIEFKKKIRTPSRNPQQKELLRPKCAKLTRLFRGKQVIIDDESYFRLSNSDLSGNSGFYSSDVSTTPNSVKLKRVAKFEPKLLVWVAISPLGMSSHFIVPSGQAVNEDVYIQHCLKARLVPFIKRVHADDEIVFWPDLASSHYSKKVLAYLKSENIDIVPKAINPANAPEVRPIEDFWTEIKRIVYDGAWEANNLEQLRNRINYAFKKVDMKRVHALGNASFTRVDTVRRHGLQNL
jgi:transposase